MGYISTTGREFLFFVHSFFRSPLFNLQFLISCSEFLRMGMKNEEVNIFRMFPEGQAAPQEVEIYSVASGEQSPRNALLLYI